MATSTNTAPAASSAATVALQCLSTSGLTSSNHGLKMPRRTPARLSTSLNPPRCAAGRGVSPYIRPKNAAESSLAIAAYATAASATEAAMGPPLTMLLTRSAPKSSRPNPVASPTVPTNDAGMRTEPPPSKPTANGTMPSATATQLPPDEPPE